MSKPTKAPAVAKTVNYTPEMEAAIIAASPLNLDSATALGLTIGKSAKSVIAKAKSMAANGADVEYIVKAPAKKRVGVVTKAELVAQVTKALSSGFDLTGLEKSPATAIKNLLSAVQHRATATTS